MQQIKLFTTAGCHLCEQALQLLESVQQSGKAEMLIELVDIAEDEALVERYGIRIPVLQIIENGAELGWPFDTKLLQAFLQYQGR